MKDTGQWVGEDALLQAIQAEIDKQYVHGSAKSHESRFVADGLRIALDAIRAALAARIPEASVERHKDDYRSGGDANATAYVERTGAGATTLAKVGDRVGTIKDIPVEQAGRSSAEPVAVVPYVACSDLADRWFDARQAALAPPAGRQEADDKP